MKALLLAAGLGTRLRPVTELVPKCLVPIRGVPLLDHWLDLLLDSGKIDRVLINTFYRAAAVRDHVSASRWCQQIDLAHEAVLLGTGGTILAQRRYLSEAAFLVAHADNLTRFNVAAFIARHRARPSGCAATMMTFDTDLPRDCGIVEQDEDQGIIYAMHEKVDRPPGTVANGAVYIFEPSVLEFIVTLRGPIIDLSTEVLPEFLGRIVAFHNGDYHRDIGTPESLHLRGSRALAGQSRQEQNERRNDSDPGGPPCLPSGDRREGAVQHHLRRIAWSPDSRTRLIFCGCIAPAEWRRTENIFGLSGARRLPRRWWRTMARRSVSPTWA